MSEELKQKEFHAGKTGVYRFQRDAWDGWVLHDCTVPPQPIRQFAVGGAFSGEDPLFPNAKVFISETEIGFWTQPNPDTSELRDVPPELIKLTFEIARNGVRTLKRQTISFKSDDEIIPGVTTLALPGHTPGHSGFLFEFGEESFIAAGDFAHDPLLQLARPEWTIIGDTHRATTVRTRKSLLKRLAENRIRFHAYHFPFPCVGHVRTTDHQSYEFVPERWVWR